MCHYFLLRAYLYCCYSEFQSFLPCFVLYCYEFSIFVLHRSFYPFLLLCYPFGPVRGLQGCPSPTYLLGVFQAGECACYGSSKSAVRFWSLCFDASNVRCILYDSQSHCATNSGNFVVLCGKYDCCHWYSHKTRFRSVSERSSSLYWYPQTRIVITISVIIGGYLSELFLQFQ